MKRRTKRGDGHGSTRIDEPRDYYVTVRRDMRTIFLAGPFNTHAEALAMAKVVRAEAIRVNSWTVFEVFGTVSLSHRPRNPLGILNTPLGIVAKRIRK